MNHFFALSLPPDVREAVADFAHFWRTYTGTEEAARWHGQDDYHVTLKFLGDTPPDDAAAWIGAGEAVAARHAPFALALSTPSAFPNIFRPRILYVGVKGTPALHALASDLEAALEPLGFAPESRPYAPHVTVARVRPNIAPKRGWRTPHEQAFATWRPAAFHLMRTEPAGGESRYTRVHTLPLAGGGE